MWRISIVAPRVVWQKQIHRGEQTSDQPQLLLLLDALEVAFLVHQHIGPAIPGRTDERIQIRGRPMDVM
jgi:hypothetical protein